MNYSFESAPILSARTERAFLVSNLNAEYTKNGKKAMPTSLLSILTLWLYGRKGSCSMTQADVKTFLREECPDVFSNWSEESAEARIFRKNVEAAVSLCVGLEVS